MPKIVDIFKSAYTARYERMWLPGVNTYEASSLLQTVVAESLQQLDDNSRVLEIGVGTGNSTIVFANCYPEHRIVALDVSELLWVLQYKLEKLDPSGTLYPLIHQLINSDHKIVNNIQRLLANKLPAISEQVVAVRAEGQEIPLPTSSVDRIHMVQVMHWLGFSPESGNGLDAQYWINALKELRRVLKPGGLLLFDEAGLHFDFQNRINDMQVFEHPFFLRAEEALANLILQQLNQKVSFGKPGRKINSYHHMFNIDQIEEYLHSAGFRLQSLPQPNSPFIQKFEPHISLQENASSPKYLMYHNWQDANDLMLQFLDGGVMTYFTGKLAELDQEIKTQLLQTAMDMTLQTNPSIFQQQAAQTFVFFAAKAV